MPYARLSLQLGPPMTVPLDLSLLADDAAVLFDRDVADRLPEFMSLWPPGVDHDTGERLLTTLHFHDSPPALYLANGRNRLRIAQYLGPTIGWELRRYSLLRPRADSTDDLTMWDLPADDARRYESTYMQMGVLVERQYLMDRRVRERSAETPETAARTVPAAPAPQESPPRAPSGSSEGT